MAGSYFEGLTSSDYITPKIVWSSVADTENNTSDVTAKFYLKKSSSSTSNTYGNGSWVISINGQTTTITQDDYVIYNDNTYRLVGQATKTVSHNTDGTKDCTIYVSGGMPGTSYTTTSCSDSVTLDTIPRGSVIGTISAFNLEDAFSVPVTKYSSSFTDTLTIKYGSTTITTFDGYTNGTTINLTDDEILAAYNAMGSALSGSFTFQITTKSGSTTIGTDSDTATGTAAGTIYRNIGGTWKRCLPHRNIGGTWKRCIAYRNIGGTWKRGI